MRWVFFTFPRDLVSSKFYLHRGIWYCQCHLGRAWYQCFPHRIFIFFLNDMYDIDTYIFIYWCIYILIGAQTDWYSIVKKELMVCKYPEGGLCSSFPVLKQQNNWNPLVSDCKDDYFEKILAGKVWYELPVKFKVLVMLESLQQRGSRYMTRKRWAESSHVKYELYTCVWLTLFSPGTNCFSWKGRNFHEFWWEAWVLSSISQSIILVSSTVSEYYIKIVWWISPSPDLFPEFVWYVFLQGVNRPECDMSIIIGKK